MINRLIIFNILFLVTTLGYGQNYKKAFKALESKNYTSARVIFAQAQSNASSQSIGDYGISKIQRATSLREDDLFKAYASIVDAEDSWDQCDEEIKQKYASEFSLEKIQEERKSIEQQLYYALDKKNDLKLWQRYISECPNAEYHNMAVNKRDEMAYQLALTRNTIPHWESFITSYPGSSQMETAKLKLYGLAWAECLQRNEIEGYNVFILAYPNAPQSAEAQNKIVELAYQRAVVLSTPDAFTSFIAQYPQSQQAAKLKKREIQVNYEKAIKFQSIEFCQDFINQYPNSKYTEEITTLRDSLAYIEAYKLNTPEAFQSFVYNYPKAKQVTKVMAQLTELLYSKEELLHFIAKKDIAQRGLKSFTVYQIDAQDSSKKHIEEEKRFDLYGNCIYHLKENEAAQREIYKFTYDDAGDQLLKTLRFHNDRIKEEITYGYNIQGLKVWTKTKCLYDCNEANSFFYDSLQYDNRRNLLKMERKNSVGVIIEMNSYKYDNQGNRISEASKVLINDSTYEYRTTHKYNAMGYNVQSTTQDLLGDIKSVGSYTYDGLGKLITSSYYDASGTFLRTYFYDERGLLRNETMRFEEYNGNEVVKVYMYQFR